MSRTFRRKGYEETQRNSWFNRGRKIAGYYTVSESNGHWRIGTDGYFWHNEYLFRKPTEHERNKEFWRIHGDNKYVENGFGHPAKFLRQQLHRRARQAAKQELFKFYTDAEYEPIISVKCDCKWWYYD